MYKANYLVRRSVTETGSTNCGLLNLLLLGLFASELILGLVLLALHINTVHGWNGFSLGNHGRKKRQTESCCASEPSGGPKGRLWTTTINIGFLFYGIDNLVVNSRDH